MKIKRPFAVRYNPYNQSIEILSNAQQVSNIVTDLKGDVCIIFDALKKLEGSKGADGGDKGSRKDGEGSIQELKLRRQYQKLEKAFRDLSLDIGEPSLEI